MHRRWSAQLARDQLEQKRLNRERAIARAADAERQRMNEYRRALEDFLRDLEARRREVRFHKRNQSKFGGGTSQTLSEGSSVGSPAEPRGFDFFKEDILLGQIAECKTLRDREYVDKGAGHARGVLLDTNGERREIEGQNDAAQGSPQTPSGSRRVSKSVHFSPIPDIDRRPLAGSLQVQKRERGEEERRENKIDYEGAAAQNVTEAQERGHGSEPRAEQDFRNERQQSAETRSKVRGSTRIPQLMTRPRSSGSDRPLAQESSADEQRRVADESVSPYRRSTEEQVQIIKKQQIVEHMMGRPHRYDSAAGNEEEQKPVFESATSKKRQSNESSDINVIRGIGERLVVAEHGLVSFRQQSEDRQAEYGKGTIQPVHQFEANSAPQDDGMHADDGNSDATSNRAQRMETNKEEKLRSRSQLEEKNHLQSNHKAEASHSEGKCTRKDGIPVEKGQTTGEEWTEDDSEPLNGTKLRDQQEPGAQRKTTDDIEARCEPKPPDEPELQDPLVAQDGVVIEDEAARQDVGKTEGRLGTEEALSVKESTKLQQKLPAETTAQQQEGQIANDTLLSKQEHQVMEIKREDEQDHPAEEMRQADIQTLTKKSSEADAAQKILGVDYENGCKQDNSEQQKTAEMLQADTEKQSYQQPELGEEQHTKDERKEGDETQPTHSGQELYEDVKAGVDQQLNKMHHTTEDPAISERKHSQNQNVADHTTSYNEGSAAVKDELGNSVLQNEKENPDQGYNNETMREEAVVQLKTDDNEPSDSGDQFETDKDHPRGERNVSRRGHSISLGGITRMVHSDEDWNSNDAIIIDQDKQKKQPYELSLQDRATWMNSNTTTAMPFQISSTHVKSSTSLQSSASSMDEPLMDHKDEQTKSVRDSAASISNFADNRTSIFSDSVNDSMSNTSGGRSHSSTDLTAMDVVKDLDLSPTALDSPTARSASPLSSHATMSDRLDNVQAFSQVEVPQEVEGIQEVADPRVTEHTDTRGQSVQSEQRLLGALMHKAQGEWRPSVLIHNSSGLSIHVGMFAYGKFPSALLNFQNDIQPGQSAMLTAPFPVGLYTLQCFLACGPESAFRLRDLVLNPLKASVGAVTTYFARYRASTFSTEAGRDLSSKQDKLYALLRKAEAMKNVPICTSSGWFISGIRCLRFSGGPEMFYDGGRMVLRVTKNTKSFDLASMVAPRVLNGR